jgi:HAE1 family hydrophobic/amphiphilic exporter-1
MQKLAELCIKRPIFASVLILLLVVIGTVGFAQLGVDRYPKVEFPTITVSTTQTGASAESIETEVTDKIEETVNTISGIETLTSFSKEGSSTVAIQFVLEKNADVAAQEVRDKVNQVLNDLPEDVDTPVVTKQESDAGAVIGIVLSGGNGIKELTEYADKVLRRRVESVSGVGRVDVLGGRQRQINIHLDPYKMRGYNVTATQVINAIQRQNADIPGGRIDKGDLSSTLRFKGRIKSVDAFNRVSIKAQGGGKVMLSDIGRVEDGIADAVSASELNGEPVVYLAISKQSGTNTVAVVELIRERIEQLKPDIAAAGYDMRFALDQSQYIEASIHAVEEHLIIGSVLACIIVLIFLLNWRATIISALAIPTSIIATFGLMWIMGFTLNTLTLLALTLSVGIVIDDAIVVIENITHVMEERGLSPFEAAIVGTQEIGFAVMATTLSLVAVFLPVAFMSGIVGRFMNSFGLTMAFAIMVSLLVAFTLAPMMAARILKSSKKSPADAKANDQGHGNKSHSNKSHGSSKESGFYGVIDRTYTAMLIWSLKHRWVIGIVCVATIASAPYIAKQLPANFTPQDDESQFLVIARAPEGTSLEKTSTIARRITNEVKKLPQIEYAVMNIGGGGASAARNNATLFVRLKPIEDRKESQDDVMKIVSEQIMPKFAAENLITAVTPYNAFGGGGASYDVTYALSGPDLDKLDEVSTKLVASLKKRPDIAFANTNYISGSPEITVDVDRELAAQLGVEPADVAQALNYFVSDNEISNYEEGGEQYEVHVRADQVYRSDEEGLSLLTVPSNPTGDSASAGAVPISQVVNFDKETGPSTINRINRQRQISVQVAMRPGGSSQAVMDQLQQEFKAMNLGASYRAQATGNSSEQGKAFAAFGAALLLSVVFIYLILAAQFESWLHPITILLSLPLTIPFALLSIWIFGGSLNLFSMLGILVLFGVVKKNAILQIDHTNQLREQGMPREEAIIAANRDRLRPILMTTIAFVAGMLPLIVSSGVGAGTNRSIGSVIFGGQTMSLLLTLLATPVAYSWFDDLSGAAVRLRTRIFGKGVTPQLPEALVQADAEK